MIQKVFDEILETSKKRRLRLVIPTYLRESYNNNT